jgi:hypothetical protein
LASPFTTRSGALIRRRTSLRIGGFGAQHIARCCRTGITVSTAYCAPRLMPAGTRPSPRICSMVFCTASTARVPLKKRSVGVISGTLARRVGGSGLATSTQYTFSLRTSRIREKYGRK